MGYEYAPYPSHSAFDISTYYLSNRNAPLSMSHNTRPDPRACPITRPNRGMRTRSSIGQDDGADNSNNSARRRISVACVRCRKRKIRCSGNTGNGFSCTSCKQAGIDTSLCQFHRVASADAIAFSMLITSGFGSGIPNTPIPIFSTSGSGLYHRALTAGPTPLPIDARAVAVCPQTWTSPSVEETSPVEIYNLDRSAAFIPNPNIMTNGYGQNYRWYQGNHDPRAALQNEAGAYLSQDQSYTTNGLSYIHTPNFQATTPGEPLSPLNLTSIHSALPFSLPERPRVREAHVVETPRPQRRLPMPQPSPAPFTRNTVDLLQDQRLRSVQIASSSSMNMNGSFTTPTIACEIDASESDTQSTPPLETSSAEVVTKIKTSPSIKNIASGAISYMPTSTSSSEVTSTTSANSQLTFNTSSLLESMAAPEISAAYSNFRNYALPTSSSTDSVSLLARQTSQTNLYSFNTHNITRRGSANEPSSEGALVSGQEYKPLAQPTQTRHSTNVEALQPELFDKRHTSAHRHSLSNLDSDF